MNKETLILKLLEYGIIKFNFKQPITFKSGIKSPIYCNFRECTAHDDLRDIIVANFIEFFEGKIDSIFGVAVGALPHSELLAATLGLPSGYVRPGAKIKDHGLNKLIEGCSVSGTVGLIEDLVSTGGSVIENAIILKKEGAEKIIIASIFSYDMEISRKEFIDAGFVLNPLITIHDLMPYLKKILSEEKYKSLEDWVRDPAGWFDRNKNDFEFGYLTQLRRAAHASGSIICMGLDPVIDALPDNFKKMGIYGFYLYMKNVLTEMKAKGISPGAFKPNLAWWLCHDKPFEKMRDGSDALSDLLYFIRINFPTIPVILDNKTGDIGTSSACWAMYGYEGWGANAVTVHSYMGKDSVSPYIAYCNKEKTNGAYLLVKTTNSGASDLELEKLASGLPVYEHVANKVIGWAKGNPGVGVVTAGNSPLELTVLGKMFAGKDMPALIPGVGPSQGGDAGQIATILKDAKFELALARLNLSSGLTHPWYKKGQPNPEEKECIDLTVRTMITLNEAVGYIPCSL